MDDIERIGDHIDSITDVSRNRKSHDDTFVDRESLEDLFSLHRGCEQVLSLVIESLDPDRKDFQAMAEAVLKARDEYMEKSIHVKANFTTKVAERTVTSCRGHLFYGVHFIFRQNRKALKEYRACRKEACLLDQAQET